MATQQRNNIGPQQRRQRDRRRTGSAIQKSKGPEAAPKKMRTKRRRRRNTGFLLRFLTMLAVVVAVTLGIVLFFRIHTITVQGNSLYSEQEIIQAAGLTEGENLITIRKSSLAGKIIAALPYVEEVRIARVLPDTVVISVKESEVAFSIEDEAGQKWLMNSDGKVLEPANEEKAQSHPAILGVTAQSPTVGSQVKGEPADSLEIALRILEELEGTGILPQISSINVEKTFDLVLWYGDQYEIKLGSSEDLSYKITYLAAVLEQLDDYQTGTIDLTFDEKRVARFLPREIENS